jgi:hypothetical protein
MKVSSSTTGPVLPPSWIFEWTLKAGYTCSNSPVRPAILRRAQGESCVSPARWSKKSFPDYLFQQVWFWISTGTSTSVTSARQLEQWVAFYASRIPSLAPLSPPSKSESPPHWGTMITIQTTRTTTANFIDSLATTLLPHPSSESPRH